MTPRRSPGCLRDDDGQVLLLTLLYVILALSLVVVVIDATAVHLARTQLLDAADAAALDAADSIDVASTYGQADDASTDGQPTHLALTDASVRRQVDAYLSTYQPPTRVDGVVVAPGTGSRDGRSATVVLTGSVRLPLVGAVVRGWTDGIDVTVRSTAVAPVDDE